MYNSHIAHLVNHQKVFEIGSRLLEFFALNIKSVVYKNNDDNETLAYFLKSIKKPSTVLDIGSHNEEYLFFILKMAKRSGKLIAFENEPNIYNYLFEKKEILKLKNVDIEKQTFSEAAEKSSPGVLSEKKKGATVIDFYTTINRETKEVNEAVTLDNYCMTNNIEPDFLKINGDGNELIILNGAINILQRYKPTILIECEERREARDKILQIFKFLTDLKYSGYFILDTMKLPLSNFDFNIYQNPFSNFYCKDFIFE